LEITGLVRDASGHALPAAELVALGAAHETIARAQTDATGRFTLTGEGIVMVRATGPDWTGPAAAVRSLPRLWRVPGTPRPARAETEIVLRAGRPVALRAFAADGALLRGPLPEHARQLTHVWFRDSASRVASGAFRWRVGDEGPWMFLPPDQPTQLELLWPAPGFGTVVCHARNGEDGFMASDTPCGLTVAADGMLELWLNEALALTAAARLEAMLARSREADYTFGSDVAAHCAVAHDRLAAMDAVILAAPGDAFAARRQRAVLADAALVEALWGLEKLVLQRAEQDIVRHKHLQRTLQVTLSDGTPAAGAELRYRQVQHAFNFGIFVNPVTHPVSREPFDGKLWTALKELGINHVTLPFLWSRHEPTRGQRRDAEQDAVFPAADLARAGYRLKGHISVWPWHGRYPDQWDAYTPGWLYTLSAADVQEAAYHHQYALAAFNHECVYGFQAINEPMLSHTNAVNLTLPETLELTRRSSAGLRAGGSTGPIEVNNCCVFAESVNADVHEQGYERMPLEFFEDLEAAGIDYDVVGIQLYYGGYMMSRLFQGGFPIRHLADLSDVIDRASAFGKPVNVSEVSTPSEAPPADGPFVGEWHGPWTPERQADWIRCFYTLCYSKPMVQEVSWWNPTDEAAFIYSGGLMADDYQPKPAYHALRDLIHGWLAHGETRVSPSGWATFSGAAGVYAIQIVHQGCTYGPYRVTLGAQAEVVLA